MPALTSNGVALDTSHDAFGELRASNDCMDDINRLRKRLFEDGYLLLRDFLDMELVLDARRAVLERLAEKKGILDENYPLTEARASPYFNRYLVEPEFSKLPALRKLLYAKSLIALFTALLGGRVRPLDYVWARVVGNGRAERPHCDIVYMGRGTKDLYTSWLPLVDVPRHRGPLMILEKSHRLEVLEHTYWNMDSEKTNFIGRNIRFKHGNIVRDGRYSKNPARVQREFGLRWLTTEFYTGDVMLFSAKLMHSTLDNVSGRLRLTCDTRYQLASEPVDERWIGENPIGHSRCESGVLDHLMDAYLRVREILYRRR